jgi:two-component system chemotaxis sensor kinase CheA
MSKSRSKSKADREFVSEAEEILEAMRTDIADLCDRDHEAGEHDPEQVNRLFRSAHSLKALAGMFHFDPIQDLAHRLEDILDGLRLGRVSLGGRTLELIEESIQMFASLLGNVGDAGALSTSADEIANLTRRIEEATHEPEEESGELEGLNLNPSLLRALTEYEEHRLRENIRRGRCIVLVDVSFEIISFEEGLSDLSEAIRETGEVLSTLPTPGETPESQIKFSLLVATELSTEALANRIDFPTASVHTVLVASSTASASAAAQPVAAEVPQLPESRETLSSGAAEVEPEAPTDTAAFESLKSISDTVRVDIRKLDELMNLVGELVIQRGAMGDLIMQLSSNGAAARLGNEFGKVHKALDRKLRDLQSAVLDVRMVPLRHVFEKVSRVVRRMRRELEKDVALDIRGADTELDKLIVEALVDPLMHVVRNALDHAIEPLEERIAAGKDPVGRITIEAFQRGNHVVIAVSDDGKGIDTDALRERAESAGLVAAGEVLSEKETLDLAFAPGISTRTEITQTSGRGVGMDVARSNLTALGGVVGVESVRGRGTTISITLPITLAIIQSLIVRAADQRFAIPLNAVMETLVIDTSEIQHSEGCELLNLRGEAIQLRRLASEFGLESDTSVEKPYVIVIRMGDQRVGLLVDRLEGQQDTVIKPILGPIRSVKGIAGATDLGDQSPVLVIDAAALVEDTARRRDAA